LAQSYFLSDQPAKAMNLITGVMRDFDDPIAVYVSVVGYIKAGAKDSAVRGVLRHALGRKFNKLSFSLYLGLEPDVDQDPLIQAFRSRNLPQTEGLSLQKLQTEGRRHLVMIRHQNYGSLFDVDFQTQIGLQSNVFRMIERPIPVSKQAAVAAGLLPDYGL
jgi:hypothetical protein